MYIICYYCHYYYRYYRLFFSLFLALSLSLSCSFSLSFSLTLFLSLSLSIYLSFSLSLFLSHSLSLFFSLSLSPLLSLCLSLSLPLYTFNLTTWFLYFPLLSLLYLCQLPGICQRFEFVPGAWIMGWSSDVLSIITGKSNDERKKSVRERGREGEMCKWVWEEGWGSGR